MRCVKTLGTTINLVVSLLLQLISLEKDRRMRLKKQQEPKEDERNNNK